MFLCENVLYRKIKSNYWGGYKQPFSPSPHTFLVGGSTPQSPGSTATVFPISPPPSKKKYIYKSEMHSALLQFWDIKCAPGLLVLEGHFLNIKKARFTSQKGLFHLKRGTFSTLENSGGICPCVPPPLQFAKSYGFQREFVIFVLLIIKLI